MKILLITSENLNSKDTLSSTFELSQAEILSKNFDVAIISVQVNDSLVNFIKTKIKSLKFSFKKNTKVDFSNIRNACTFLFLRKSKINRYLINNIPVYEGIGYNLYSRCSFKTITQNWTSAGLQAFQAYCKDKSYPSVIHAHGRFLMAGILAYKIKENYNIPYVYTEHSTFYQRGIALEESKAYLNKVVENASFFIAVSQSLLQSVSTFIDKEPPRPIIIPNVVDRIFETPIKIKSTTIFTFITVASLEYKKGIDVLLKAFKIAFGNSKDVQLLICGDGPLKQSLELLSVKLNISTSVKFLGKKNKEEVKELMDYANVLVSPSRMETFGVVVIEALARGCPVIATKCGGPEHILRNKWGILLDPENEEKLSSELEKIKNNYITYAPLKIHEESLLIYGSKAFLTNMDHIYSSILINTL